MKEQTFPAACRRQYPGLARIFDESAAQSESAFTAYLQGETDQRVLTTLVEELFRVLDYTIIPVESWHDAFDTVIRKGTSEYPIHTIRAGKPSRTVLQQLTAAHTESTVPHSILVSAVTPPSERAKRVADNSGVRVIDQSELRELVQGAISRLSEPVHASGTETRHTPIDPAKIERLIAKLEAACDEAETLVERQVFSEATERRDTVHDALTKAQTLIPAGSGNHQFREQLTAVETRLARITSALKAAYTDRLAAGDSSVETATTAVADGDVTAGLRACQDARAAYADAQAIADCSELKLRGDTDETPQDRLETVTRLEQHLRVRGEIQEAEATIESLTATLSGANANPHNPQFQSELQAAARAGFEQLNALPDDITDPALQARVTALENQVEQFETAAQQNRSTNGAASPDEGTSTRDELISELQELANDWDTINRKLLYSVGDHHPDEYDDVFGNIDAALDEAGLTDTIAGSDDTAAETNRNSTDTTPSTTTGKQPQSADSSTMTDLPSNELAELYVAFDRFQHLLTELAGELDTNGTTPMERWAEAVADHWGSGGPAGAPNYGVQQRDRNDFSIRDYRDVHGDGDRVTDFHHVEFAPVDDRIRHLLGDAIDDWNHAVPVAPESNTPPPVAIASTEALDTALKLLDEFPAYPDAERPAPDETDMGTDGPVLPDGRVDTLTVTVLDHDPNPGSKRDARLQVELSDGTELSLDIWSTHDLSLDWTVDNTYTIEQARHKSWETSTGTGHQLSSTKDFRVTSADAGSTGPKPNINPPSRASADASSTSGRTPETSTSGEKSASSSGRSRTGSRGTPSRGELRDAIQRVAETIDRPLKASYLSDTTEYSVNDVTRVFGSWQNGLAAAGIDNEARLIDDLHRVADELGHRPTTTDMNEHGHVSATTYATYFGTYTAAIEQAFNEAETTRSVSGTNTTDQTNPTSTETSTTKHTATTERDTGNSEQNTTSSDEATGTTPDDDGILGEIMNDFDELSDSEAE